EKDDGHHFLIRNSTPCDVTVTIKLADIENGRSDAASPWTKTLHPKSTLTAFRLTSNNSLEPLKYKYTWDWRYGTPDAIHDDSNNYLLPFDQRVLQESLNGLPQNQDGSSRWCLPIGAAIRVAREGKVLEVSSHTSPTQIVIKHGDGTIGSYRGFADITVKPGQKVKRGDNLGEAGDKQVHGPVTVFYFWVWKPIDGENETYFSVKFSTEGAVPKTSL